MLVSECNGILDLDMLEQAADEARVSDKGESEEQIEEEDDDL